MHHGFPEKASLLPSETSWLGECGKLMNQGQNQCLNPSITPKLCDELSVMAKSIFSTRSFSENLHPVAAESILKVMSSNSLRVARDSENILNVGNTRCFPSIENDWPITSNPTLG